MLHDGANTGDGIDAATSVTKRSPSAGREDRGFALALVEHAAEGITRTGHGPERDRLDADGRARSYKDSAFDEPRRSGTRVIRKSRAIGGVAAQHQDAHASEPIAYACTAGQRLCRGCCGEPRGRNC